MSWASYEFHDEPRFRLIFEGDGAGRPIEELRVLDPVGVVRATAQAFRTDTEPLRLCGSGRTYGPTRATIIAQEPVFKEFIRDNSRYRVEVRVSGTWQIAALVNLCHATQ